MRIVYCLNSIRYLGGIQRVTIIKANALAEISGNEVYVLVTDNQEGIQTLTLSDKVHLIDLGINYYDGDRNRSRIANFFVNTLKRKTHRKLLYNTLCDIKPDVVISIGQSEKYMLTSMRDRSWKVIREFHYERNYRKALAKSKKDKVIAWLLDLYDFNIKEKKYDRIVVLTNEDIETNWNGWKNVEMIPNPVSFTCEEPSLLINKTIVALGRLDHQKNFASLINSFSLVSELHPDWTLRIYGVGSQERMLNERIQTLNLQDRIKLMGYTKDVQSALKDGSIFCLSSIEEGFALVIVEAMECGVPVVSYQCPCGPKDIVSDGVDGFLVPVNDERTMADRICQLIEDEELRHKMGAAAKETAKKYHIENITKQWMQLFNELINT